MGVYWLTGARFLLEIILGIKKELGVEFPVWCKLSATEFGVAGGLSIEQAQAIARMVEEVGGNAIEVSASGDWVHSIPPAGSPPGLLVPLAEKIKGVVGLPLIATSKISPELGETLLAEGKADMIAMGRALLADPELVNKLAEGRTENIRPCIGCMRCIDETISDNPLRCTVNASLGKELEATGQSVRALQKSNGCWWWTCRYGGSQSTRIARSPGDFMGEGVSTWWPASFGGQAPI